jgi:hypothetical protein
LIITLALQAQAKPLPECNADGAKPFDNCNVAAIFEKNKISYCRCKGITADDEDSDLNTADINELFRADIPIFVFDRSANFDATSQNFLTTTCKKTVVNGAVIWRCS